MKSQAEFYERFARAYEFLYKVIDAERTVQQWNDLLHASPTSRTLKTRPRLLDVGCGPGWHLPHWHRRGYSVAGLDVSTAMLTFAKSEWSREVGGRTPPLYRTDLLNLSGEVLTASPFDILVLHSNILHLFSPETLRSLCGALGRLSAPRTLLMADLTHTTLLTETGVETIEIDGMTWEHTSHFDPTHCVLKQIWKNGVDTMTELNWPIDLENLDKLFREFGWLVRTRAAWDPQNVEAPFQAEWSGQTRCVTIYERTAPCQVDDRAC